MNLANVYNQHMCIKAYLGHKFDVELVTRDGLFDFREHVRYKLNGSIHIARIRAWFTKDPYCTIEALFEILDGKR